MYFLKEQKLKLSKTQKELSKEIGITESYLSKILNRKKKCSKLVAYSITKAIDPQKEILNLFERI